MKNILYSLLLLMVSSSFISQAMQVEGKKRKSQNSEELQEVAGVPIKRKANLCQLNIGLRKACYEGNLDKVSQFLIDGANINCKNSSNNETPLIIACENEYEHIVEFLLGYDANVNAVKKGKGSALHIACKKKNLKIVNLLLDTSPDILYDLDTSYAFPLNYIAKTNRVDIAAALLDNNANIEFQNDSRETPLYIASKFGQVEMMELLLKRGANIGAPDEHRVTPLLIACLNGKKDAMEVLFKHGANAHKIGQNGSLLMAFAIRSSNLNTIDYLLSKGYSIEGEEIYKEFTAKMKIGDIYNILSIFNAFPEFNDINWCVPLLYNAAELNQIQVIQWFLETKNVISARDILLETLLHTAFKFNSLDVAKYLLAKGADVQARDNNQCTPLHILSKYSRFKECDLIYFVKCLVEKGANIDAINSSQETPIQTASMSGKLSIAKYLIEKGANISQINSSDLLVAACNFGDLSFIKFIEQKFNNVDFLTRIATSRDNLLHIACRQLSIYDGCLEVIKYLLLKDINMICRVNSNNQFPLSLVDSPYTLKGILLFIEDLHIYIKLEYLGGHGNSRVLGDVLLRLKINCPIPASVFEKHSSIIKTGLHKAIFDRIMGEYPNIFSVPKDNNNYLIQFGSIKVRVLALIEDNNWEILRENNSLRTFFTPREMFYIVSKKMMDQNFTGMFDLMKIVSKQYNLSTLRDQNNSLMHFSIIYDQRNRALTVQNGIEKPSLTLYLLSINKKLLNNQKMQLVQNSISYQPLFQRILEIARA